MLDVGLSEFFVIGAVALLVVGPKELPALMAKIGRWTGKARAMARHARSGFDTMVREAEIEEMNKRWEAENARIMAATQHQTFPDILDPQPATSPPAAPESDTFLPGLDSATGEDRDRPTPAPVPAAPAAHTAQPVTEADPTDWRDPPPVMRPLAAVAPAPLPAAQMSAAQMSTAQMSAAPTQLPLEIGPAPVAVAQPAPEAVPPAPVSAPVSAPLAAPLAAAAPQAKPRRARKSVAAETRPVAPQA